MKKTLACILILALVLSLPVLAAGSYTDVAEDAWYAQAVEYCTQRGLMDGLGEGIFSPQSRTTRGMVVTVLYRLSGSPARVRAEAFPDVAEDAWYADAVGWAAVQGITRGRPDGSFGPEEYVSRQDLAVLLWRSLGSPAAAETEAFGDEGEISDYALEAVRWAKGAGIINGMGNGNFAPKQGATRAELASILMKLDVGLLGPGLLQDVARATGIAADGEGGLLVTDAYNKCVWYVKDGSAVRLAGGESPADLSGEPVGGYADGAAEESLFRRPWAIAPFLEGWVIADTKNNALRYLTAEGVGTLSAAAGETGLRVGDCGVAYDRPMGLAADGAGNLYVANTGSGSILVISPEGLVNTVISGLDEPTALCWASGSLYVAETGQHRILKVTAGTAEVLAGSGEEGFADGAALSACFSSPMGIAVDAAGRVYVADTVNGAVRRISEGQVETLLMARGDTPQTSPVSPMGLLALDGVLYICDNFTGKLMSINIG